MSISIVKYISILVKYVFGKIMNYKQICSWNWNLIDWQHVKEN